VEKLYIYAGTTFGARLDSPRWGFKRMFKKFDEFHPMQNDMIPELDASQFFRVILRRFFFCRA